MRVVFLGNHSVDYSSETHHVKSLRSIGHEVVTLQESAARGQVVLRESLKSDLLVVVHTHGWRTPGLPIDRVIKELKGKVPVITYHLDLWFGLKREKDIHNDPFYKSLDYFFATDKLMCDWFNEYTNVKGVYLPAGVYDAECLLLEPDVTKGVMFVGSKGYHPEWGYRPQLIEWLRKEYGDSFTHVGGDGDTGTVRGLELNRMYQSTKVAVGDTLCIGFDYPWYFSDRLFEQTGRGAFTIFPYIKGIEDCFEIGKEIVTYKFGDFDDLKQKIDYYLEHDEEREAIRQMGMYRTKRDHTYVNRWNTILKEVGLE